MRSYWERLKRNSDAQYEIQYDVTGVVLVFLLLTLNIFQIFF